MKDQEAGWLERLGGETSAEGIDDRISNNAYRIGPTGDVNMREATAGASAIRCACASNTGMRSSVDALLNLSMLGLLYPLHGLGYP